MEMIILLLALLAGSLAGRVFHASATAASLNRMLSNASLWGILAVMGARLALEGESLKGSSFEFLLAVASAVLLAAVLFAIFAAVSRIGRRRGSGGVQPARVHPPPAKSEKTVREFLSVALCAACIAFGFVLFRMLPAACISALPLDSVGNWLLRALLFAVGFGLGAEIHRLNLRLLTKWMLLAPFFNIAVTLVTGFLLGAVTALGARRGMLLTTGLGWYSLSSVMLAERGMVALSLLSFVHNVSRELLAILSAPLAAKVSPMLPVYLGGATSMDIMLPFVQRYSGMEYTLASFYSGAVCSLAVMPLVNAVASW